MGVEIKKFNYSDSELFSCAVAIRRKVFVNEGGVSKELEQDEFDREAVHYLLFIDEVPVATARWRETAGGIKLERFSTLLNHRNAGLGYLILKEILVDVEIFDKPIYLHAQEQAVNFYVRNGFEICGESFMEHDVEHFLLYFKKR